MNNLVSVIITTYKRPLWILKRAILSAYRQSYQNIEIIVVNDYPEDLNLASSIEKMINEFKNDRIKYIALEKNSGACKARNVGIKASKGEYIALLDDDDEWLSEKIEKQLMGFISDDIGMVYSPYYNVENDNITKKVKICLSNKSGDLSKQLLWRNCIGGCSMPIMKREVFEKCGFFDESFPALQDYEMWYRISQHYNINCINIPLTVRYLQNDSISNNYMKKLDGYKLFIEKYKDDYLENPRAYNFCLNCIAKKMFENGKIKEGINIYKKAIHIKFFSIYNIEKPFKGIIKFFLRKHC